MLIFYMYNLYSKEETWYSTEYTKNRYDVVMMISVSSKSHMHDTSYRISHFGHAINGFVLTMP